MSAKNDVSTAYLLVTPAKNEEKNLKEAADSLIRQTIKPVYWLIIDDGSTDETPKIISRLTAEYDWINSITLSAGPRDLMYHLPQICKTGIDGAIAYCEKNEIEYGFIGMFDADTVLEQNYFEKLLYEFEKDNKLGLASGGVFYDVNGRLEGEGQNENLPLGSGRLWSKECFNDIGGFLPEPSWDSISNVKAMLHGWRTAKFNDIIFIQRRKTSSAEGLWKGYTINGRMAHYVNKHPLLVALNVAYYGAMYPFYPGIAYLCGYLSSLARGERQIADPEIKNYYWSGRLKEYARQLI